MDLCLSGTHVNGLVLIRLLIMNIDEGTIPLYGSTTEGNQVQMGQCINMQLCHVEYLYFC